MKAALALKSHEVQNTNIFSCCKAVRQIENATKMTFSLRSKFNLHQMFPFSCAFCIHFVSENDSWLNFYFSGTRWWNRLHLVRDTRTPAKPSNLLSRKDHSPILGQYLQKPSTLQKPSKTSITFKNIQTCFQERTIHPA